MERQKGGGGKKVKGKMRSGASFSHLLVCEEQVKGTEVLDSKKEEKLKILKRNREELKCLLLPEYVNCSLG